MSEILYSIVIPTATRIEDLKTCLDRVLSQVHKLNRQEFEIIITDDSGKVKLALENDYAQYDQVKFNCGPAKGPASNRNSGARLALGKWLIFTDDDCKPEPQWLEAYVQVLKNPDITKDCLAFEGMILPIGDFDEELTECPWNPKGGHFWSANIVILRKLFEELGGFDESYAFPDHEDIDFQKRVEARTKINFVPEALIYHPVRKMTFLQAIAVTKKRAVIWTLHMLKQGISQNMFSYLKLIKNWSMFFIRHALTYLGRRQWIGMTLCFYRAVVGPVFILQTLLDANLRSKYSNS